MTDSVITHYTLLNSLLVKFLCRVIGYCLSFVSSLPFLFNVRFKYVLWLICFQLSVMAWVVFFCATMLLAVWLLTNIHYFVASFIKSLCRKYSVLDLCSLVHKTVYNKLSMQIKTKSDI